MSFDPKENPINIPLAIQKFLTAVQKDKRILPLHISLFIAICWGGTPEKNSAVLSIYRKDIKPLARISSSATYHKYLKELVVFGYLVYLPSNNYYSGSKVSFPNNN